VGAVEKAVDVAAADAGALDCDDDVARAGEGIDDVSEADVPGSVQDGSEHDRYNAPASRRLPMMERAMTAIQFERDQLTDAEKRAPRFRGR
jgi:hypothetical protein